MDDKNEVNIEGHTANSEETSKITEKVKDPRRVAQGKKLAAISREAKARKAREREEAIRKEEANRCEEQGNASYALYTIPIIGVIALGGYYFLELRPTNPEKNPNLEKL